MKFTGLLLLTFIFSGSGVVAAPPPAAMSTHVEQVSATINGQLYRAQFTRIQMPTDNAKTLTMDQIAVMAPGESPQVAATISIQLPTQLNGTKYIASVSEPLAPQDRERAYQVFQNNVEHVRRSAPEAVANRMAAYPTYSYAVPVGVLRADFQPYSAGTQETLYRVAQSANTNSNGAFVGLLQQERTRNEEASRYVQAIQQGQNLSLQLHNAALQSTISSSQNLGNFSLSIQSLQDRQVQNLAQRIAQADPKVENILSDNETGNSRDIRRATSDVSPLNPHAAENRARYEEMFRANGLLQNGFFSEYQAFAATPAGHRLLESANLLSDALIQDPSLSSSPSGVQLMGTGYLYLNAAMKAQAAGRLTESERFTEQGRQIARALRGEDVPDDLEKAISSTERAVELHEQAVRETLGLRGEGRELLTQAFNSAQPNTEEGRVAAALGRGLVSDPNNGMSDSEVRRVGLMLLDTALGMVPIISPIKSLIYMAVGRNLITGEALTNVDYALCAIDVLTLGTSGPLAKFATKIPDLVGFGRSKLVITEAMRAGKSYVKDFGNFVEGSVKGIRNIERVSPGFAAKQFVQNPGAVLALGQNVNRYGGEEFAKSLTSYATKNSLGIVETAHISTFGGGFTKIMTVENFAKYGSQTEMLAGKDGGRMFAVSTKEFEAVGKNKSGAELATWLGFGEDAAQSGFVRLDFPFDLKLNPRLPSGIEAGVNEFFKSGGKTSGGALEIVLDPLPMSQVNVKELMSP